MPACTISDWPTRLGRLVIDLLVKSFHDILAVDYTRSLEEQLDKIEDGEGATCAIIELEVIYSARNASEYDRPRRRRTLAYDSDFDTIADVTGQAVEWVVPRCSAG